MSVAKIDERRQLENQLLVMGLRKLTDPQLIAQLGGLVRDHEFLLGLLNECDVDKRREMFEAIRPYLRFEAQPLEHYEAQLKERASKIASRAEPITVGDAIYQEVERAQATSAIVDVTCYKCTRTAQFVGETLVDAVTKARQAGWVRDPLEQKEICPKCPAVREGKYERCVN